MNKLEIFKNEEFGEVRTSIIDGKPYFCGSDVAKALGYARPNEAVSTHCEMKGTLTCRTLTKQGEQNVKFISEGNVHRLIVAASKQSKNKDIQEKAKKYANWIFDEIMPSIRENGYYSIKDTVVEISDAPIGEVASYAKVMERVMKNQNSEPCDIAEAFEMISKQFGIVLPKNFVKKQHHEQMTMTLSLKEKSTCNIVLSD